MPLTLIFGSMFSGKSSRLITELNTDAGHGFNTAYIKSHEDTREFLTHCDKIVLSPKVNRYVTVSLETIIFNGLTIANAKKWVIGIDEAQFFENLDKVIFWSDMGCNVFVAGLVAKFDRSAFGSMNKLMSFATDFIHLKASCQRCLKELDCKVPAVYTVKKWEVKVDERGVSIGGGDKYAPSCDRCYIKGNEY